MEGAIGCFTINSLHLMFTFFILTVFQCGAAFGRHFELNIMVRMASAHTKQQQQNEGKTLLDDNNAANGFANITVLCYSISVYIYKCVCACLCICLRNRVRALFMRRVLVLVLRWKKHCHCPKFMHIIMSVVIIWIVQSNCWLLKLPGIYIYISLRSLKIEFHRRSLCLFHNVICYLCCWSIVPRNWLDLQMVLALECKLKHVYLVLGHWNPI